MTVTDWTQISSAPPPPAREYAYTAYDETRDEVVMFGGIGAAADFGATGLAGDTWTWDGATWTEKFPANSPSPREAGGMAWDPANDAVVLFGGLDDIDFVNDTWLWDGTDWTEVTPVHKPTTRFLLAMATAPGIGNVVLFGGFRDVGGGSNETWLWDGTDWLIQSPAGTPDNGNDYDCAAAYDRANNRVVLYGGHNGIAYSTNTFLWNGSTWLTTSPASNPGTRAGGRLGYLGCADSVLFWGGATSVGAEPTDSWLWDGSTEEWTQITTTDNPAGQHDPVLCGHEGRGNIVFLTGDDAPTVAPVIGGDTWIYDCEGGVAINNLFGLGV